MKPVYSWLRVPAVYLSLAIQADPLVVKVTPHFGQRT